MSDKRKAQDTSDDKQAEEQQQAEEAQQQEAQQQEAQRLDETVAGGKYLAADGKTFVDANGEPVEG